MEQQRALHDTPCHHLDLVSECSAICNAPVTRSADTAALRLTTYRLTVPEPSNGCPQNWEWPLVWEGIFTTLGLDFEVIPRPEAWVLARQTAAKATLSSRAEAVIDPARSRARATIVAAS